MANSIVNQLLHNPMTNLKEHAHGDNGALYAEAVQTLFELNHEEFINNKESML